MHWASRRYWRKYPLISLKYQRWRILERWSFTVGLKFTNGYNCALYFKVENFMRLIFWLSVSLLLPSGAIAEGDLEAGKLKSYTCTGCHGIPGYNNVYPTYRVPKIGGQNYEYMVLALKAYRDGEREHSTMELQANSLSEQDMKDVSAYFASLGSDGK